VCDTVVNVSLDGVLFAKNSDRDANESQVLEWSPAALHEASASVRCTWIEIPQVSRTNAVLLSRPWWMWGAEMGANEHGVVIGNEAVFTNQAEGEPALLGMDLLRLALERASDARGAAQVIIELLAHYGQGGSCSYEKPGFTYHNSFLIADTRGAVVLETAGDQWATEEVKSGVRSISNGLTIPSFAQQYSNRLRSTVAACKVRRARTEAAASDADGPAAMMATLRDHGDVRGPRWSPINGTLRAPCVHAGGLLASSQTTASLVSDLRSEPLHWATATSAPCTSIFKPVRVDEPVDLGPLPTNRYDPGSVWWRHERLHRRMLKDYSRLAPDFQAQRDQLEASWVAHPPSSVDAFSAGERLDEEWLEHEHGDRRDRRPSFVRRMWRRLDATAAMSNGYGVNLQR
jgi:dipeptidase